MHTSRRNRLLWFYRTRRLLAATVLVLPLTACSGHLGGVTASTPTASMSVPPDVTVCGAVSASQLSEVLDQYIDYYHFHAGVFYGYTTYGCMIDLGKSPSDTIRYRKVSVLYQPEAGGLDGSLLPQFPTTSTPVTYDDIAASPAAQPLVLDGVEGQGVTVQDTPTYAGAFAWRYPNGYVLSVGLLPNLKDSHDNPLPRNDPADVPTAVEVARELVPTIPDSATSGNTSGRWDRHDGIQYLNGHPAT